MTTNTKFQTLFQDRRDPSQVKLVAEESGFKTPEEAHAWMEKTAEEKKADKPAHWKPVLVSEKSRLWQGGSKKAEPAKATS